MARNDGCEACPPARSRSIRARLLAGILISLGAILSAAAWLSYEVARHESEELFGARLATSARVLEALAARQVEHATIAAPLVISLPLELEHAADDAPSRLGHPYETKIAFQIWRNDGTLLVRSASAPARPFGPNVAGFTTQSVEGEEYHVFVLPSGTMWIQVAEKNEVRAELIEDLGVAVMTPLVFGAVILLIVVNLLVGYGLAPLRQLAAHIARREPGSVGRISMADVPREVAPVVAALNDLLTRVNTTLERERRFNDAAAHELRTPIAALKIHAANVERAATEAERVDSMAKLNHGLDRTAKLAEQMLAYSRMQATGEHEARSAFDLAALVREVSAGAEPLRQSRRQRITIVETGDTGARVIGEREKIQRLVANLLDNASRYAPEGTDVEVTVRSSPAHVALEVANAGRAIPAELRRRVFDPYYRIPGSSSEGSGLGLAIVREIADRHGATVELTSISQDEGTRVTVTFRRARAAERASGAPDIASFGASSAQRAKSALPKSSGSRARRASVRSRDGRSGPACRTSERAAGGASPTPSASP